MREPNLVRNPVTPKAVVGYWNEEWDIGEYATVHSPLSDYREWGNAAFIILCSALYKEKRKEIMCPM